ncbi:MAG: caspase domain-containing protein [Bacteroidia bacterium]
MSTIYALLVGIDKYQAPVPALDGCVNDMRAFAEFLRKRAQRNNLDFQPIILENDQATRFNIVEKFETHLTKAASDDIAVFYYSGHGSQEPSHEVFRHIESDNLNETFVCYDSRQFDGMDLADKEMATLLSMVGEKDPHILVVTDCCNSGENTRSVGLGANDVKVRQSPNYESTRDLDSYILPRNMTEQASRSTLEVEEGTKIVVPKTRHVHLAATHSSQLAKETHLGGSPRGVFTFSLLEVLENALGPMTYHDVMRRVKSMVRQRTFEQDPQMSIFTSGDDQLEFLNGAVKIENQYYGLEYNREIGWTIDAGSVHGIIKGNTATGEKTILNIFAQDASDKEMDDTTFALGQATVSSVKAQSSVVRPEGEPFLDNSKVYRVRIHDMPVRGLKVCMRGNEAAVEMARSALAGNREASVFIEEVARNQAEYHLLANDRNEYVIIRGADADSQPMVEQVQGFTQESAEKVIGYLEHIAKWERTLALSNPSSGIHQNAVRIEICPVNDDSPMMPADGDYTFKYHEADGPEAYPRFRVKIVNTSGMELYCAFLYMSPEFEINATMLHNKGLRLQNGQEAWALEGAPLRGAVPEAVYQLGKKEVQSFFKLIYSTQDFDASLMEQSALNLPQVTRSIGNKDMTKSRNLMFDSSFSAPNRDDWNATDLGVVIRRED